MLLWKKIVIIAVLIGANVASIILCFQHYEYNGTVPISFGSDRYYLKNLLLINYQLLVSSILTTGTWAITCLMHDFLFTPDDRDFSVFAEFLFRYFCLLLFDVRIKMLIETSLAGRLSIAFGDAIGISIIAVHSHWCQKQKRC